VRRAGNANLFCHSASMCRGRPNRITGKDRGWPRNDCDGSRKNRHRCSRGPRKEAEERRGVGVR
jgi:hypothetical protein